jgi:hypothetical protein
MNKYKITKISALNGQPEVTYSFGKTKEEAISSALLRINEVTLEEEKIISVELV